MNDLFPADYKLPSKSSKYMKLEEGDNKFRFLGESMIKGYEYWTNDSKPIRERELIKEKPNDIRVNEGYSWQSSVKHFWCFVVFDYADNQIKILEIKQSTIQQPMLALYHNKKWGHFNKYDINVSKEGKGLETKYTVMPDPATPLTAEQKSLYESCVINLEALFDSEDPFAGGETKSLNSDPTTITPKTEQKKDEKISLEDLPFN